MLCTKKKIVKPSEYNTISIPEPKETALIREPKETSEGIGLENIIYAKRFTSAQDKTRDKTWQVLCSAFFQKYISPNDVVVEVGAGDGLFLRHIKAKRKIAVDISDHVNQLKTYDIEVLLMPATSFSKHINGQADTIFMSNFLEHLPTRKHVIEVFKQCHKALKPNGQIIILQPNVHYCGRRYWDFIDHHIGLTDHSLVEGLDITGFEIEHIIPRFFPFTVLSKFGTFAKGNRATFCVKLYLKLPFFWRFFGQQTFVQAKKR